MKLILAIGARKDMWQKINISLIHTSGILKARFMENREIQTHEIDPSHWCSEGHMVKDHHFVDSHIRDFEDKSQGKS